METVFCLDVNNRHALVGYSTSTQRRTTKVLKLQQPSPSNVRRPNVGSSTTYSLSLPSLRKQSLLDGRRIFDDLRWEFRQHCHVELVGCQTMACRIFDD